jgi:hypothetical protein
MTRDPIKAYQRREQAVRRIGREAACRCGESRPEALIRTKDSVCCAVCKRLALGQAAMDRHHWAGRANSLETIAISVNDHRGELSRAQHEWPRATLENRHNSPLLKAAAYVRGVTDMIRYFLDKLLLVAELLEDADRCISSRFGPQWWHDAGRAPTDQENQRG